MISDTLDTLQEIDGGQKPFKKVFRSQNPIWIFGKTENLANIWIFVPKLFTYQDKDRTILLKKSNFRNHFKLDGGDIHSWKRVFDE